MIPEIYTQNVAAFTQDDNDMHPTTIAKLLRDAARWIASNEANVTGISLQYQDEMGYYVLSISYSQVDMYGSDKGVNIRRLTSYMRGACVGRAAFIEDTTLDEIKKLSPNHARIFRCDNHPDVDGLLKWACPECFKELVKENAELREQVAELEKNACKCANSAEEEAFQRAFLQTIIVGDYAKSAEATG